MLVDIWLTILEESKHSLSVLRSQNLILRPDACIILCLSDDFDIFNDLFWLIHENTLKYNITLVDQIGKSLIDCALFTHIYCLNN